MVSHREFVKTSLYLNNFNITVIVKNIDYYVILDVYFMN